MWTHKIYEFFCGAFRPPFRHTPWIILVYLLLCVIYNTDSSFNTWHMPDTDDYIRLVQVFNWLDGQSWYDLSLPHLYPKHIITMHWARLPDVALGLVITILSAITTFFQMPFPRTAVGMLSAAIVPCGLLLLLLVQVRANTRALLGRQYAGVACFFTILAGILTFQFTPMRVDHHAYILLFAGGAFWAIQNIYLGIKPLRMAALAALSLAFAMWNGAEILPMLILSGAIFTIMAVLRGGQRFKAAAIFGISLLAFTALILPLAKLPVDYGLIEYDTFSVFYVLIAGVAAVYFSLLFAISCVIRHRGLLAALALFLAVSAVAIFLHYFPDFILGPYSKVNPLLNFLFFPNIREAVPLTKSWIELGDTFGFSPKQSIGGGIYYLSTRIFLPLIALAACISYVLNKKISTRQRGLWLIYLGLCLSFDLLTTFWQVRLLTYAQLFAIPPVATLMVRYLHVLPLHYKGRSLYMWEILTVFCFTLFPAVVVPAIIGKDRFMPDMLFFLGKGNGSACKTASLIETLYDFEKDDKKISNIMAPMDFTPELMYYTHHNYIAAPYHRNDRGILDMMMFFRSMQDDRAAREIAKRLDLDYVVLCKKTYNASTMRLEKPKNVGTNKQTGELQENIDDKSAPTSSLAARLVNDRAPAWLSRFPIMYDDEFLLFRVKKELLDKPTTYPPTKKKADKN